MKRSYKRNRAYSGIMITLGLMFAYSIIINENTGWLNFCASILFLISGSWGIVTPIAQINNKQLKVELSLFRTITFDLDTTSVAIDSFHRIMYFSDLKQNVRLKLSNMDRSDREIFKIDLGKFVKGTFPA